MKCKLGTLASVKGGKRLPKGISLVSTPNSHPYIRVRDLNGQRTLELNSNYEFVDNETQKQIARYIVQKEDIVLSIVGTIGLVAIVGESLDNANLTENCVKIVVSEKMDSKFLYYYLKSPIGQAEIAKGTVGAVQAKLPIKNIQDIDVWVPQKDIQTKIASTLSCIDDKIELNNKINENLERQARSLYKAMFIDNPNVKTTEGMLCDIAEITMGQSPTGSSYNEEGNGEIFYQGRAEFGFRFPTRRLFTTEPKRMAETNDVLLSVRAPVGDLNVAYEQCCVGRGLSAIHSKDGNSSFLLYTMFALKPQLDVFNGEGTVFGSINKQGLSDLPVDIPCADEIAKFESIVRPMDNLIRTNYEENCRLQALRDSLLPKLMSGEIDIENVDF